MQQRNCITGWLAAGARGRGQGTRTGQQAGRAATQQRRRRRSRGGRGGGRSPLGHVGAGGGPLLGGEVRHLHGNGLGMGGGPCRDRRTPNLSPVWCVANGTIPPSRPVRSHLDTARVARACSPPQLHSHTLLWVWRDTSSPTYTHWPCCQRKALPQQQKPSCPFDAPCLSQHSVHTQCDTRHGTL